MPYAMEEMNEDTPSGGRLLRALNADHNIRLIVVDTSSLIEVSALRMMLVLSVPSR